VLPCAMMNALVVRAGTSSRKPPRRGREAWEACDVTKAIGELTDDELRQELARTQQAYADYVADVGVHPDHSAVDLPAEARRHLQAIEEVERRHEGTVPPPSAGILNPPVDSGRPTARA
jgi:hypothetical protein